MIKVENLYKRYGTFQALTNLSFTVKQGEILGLLGPNGAGKTTTMKILTGFFPPSEGTVEIAGLSIDKHLIDIKKRIGYLPENVPLYHDLTVLSFLRFVAQVKGIPRKQRSAAIKRVIEECALHSVCNKFIKTLSKGYRQRVGLAQALLGNPDILILDEPTIGLDPQQIIEIRQLIKKMAGFKTVILSSHILPEVSMISDRIIIINNGELIASDTPENLYQRMQSSRDISVLVEGDEDTILEIIHSIPQVLSVSVTRKINNENEYVVSSNKEYDIRNELAAAIVKSRKKLRLLGLTTVSMSLEDIFMKLVTKEDIPV